ncbi:MAG: Holliday junction branch migration protein RuvA [Bacteroidota bacterium]|nr:Holliday junction branch migration protein RuvA [Bacteroidota bacterium]MDX5431309.1 Holliday junction branch migration protein RuvA [Bacteroidota bacterium]MDX5470047.1 Holliday junction branch migration protein RuvA [Bacteroidota bacterium]
MYAHFTGKVSSINPTSVVVDCGGVGYELHISLYSYAQLKELKEAKVYAHLVVKEDAHTLYGFVDEAERQLFRQLISVQGIGASTARMILSSTPPQDLVSAIIQGNVALLKSVKGVGPKSAQRIVLELQDKLQKQDMEAGYSLSFASGNQQKSEAVDALVMLGFAKSAVEKAVSKILDAPGSAELQVEEIIKRALKTL